MHHIRTESEEDALVCCQSECRILIEHKAPVETITEEEEMKKVIGKFRSQLVMARTMA